jgi:hypothetical protein
LWADLWADIGRHLWISAAQVTGLIWLFHLWLAPIFAPILTALSSPRSLRRRDRAVILKEPNAQEEERQEEEQLAHFKKMTTRMHDASTQQADRSIVGPAASSSVTLSPALVLQVQNQPGAILGAYQGGELAELVYGGKFYLSPDLLALHGIIAGEPGAGKTTTLIRLAAIAQAYGRRVIFLDLKGSRRTAAFFLAAMAALGVDDARVYPLAAYDGWRGDAQALYNKLMQQISPASHPFYRAGVGSAIVSLACKAPGGPPRSSYQFLERLDTAWLRKAYASDPQALREIRDVEPHIGGVNLVFAGFFRGINGALDGTWAYEDAPACYIGIDGVAHREEAASLGRFLLDDAAHFASVRKASDEQAFLIIDEFGVLESTNATGLYEKVREAGMSVYASGQSYQALGRERDALLAASAVKILHRVGAPEPFIKYAGEREVYKFSRRVGGEGEEETDLLHPLANQPDQIQGLMRPEKEYAIKGEEVQQLARGRVAIITGGQGAYVQVEPLAIPPALLQAAAHFIRDTPRFTPAPPPQLPPAPPQQQGQQQPRPKSSSQQRKPTTTTGRGPTHRPKRPQFSPPPAGKQRTTSAQQQSAQAHHQPAPAQQSAQASSTPPSNPPQGTEELEDFFS